MKAATRIMLYALVMILVLGLVLIPATVLANGGGGGGGGGGDNGNGNGDHRGNVETDENTSPPEGFVTISPLPELNILVLESPSMESSGTSDDSRTLEENIVVMAGQLEQEQAQQQQSQPLSPIEQFNQAQQFLNSLPTELADDIRQQYYSSAEILQIRNQMQMQQIIKNIKDPELQAIVREALNTSWQQHVQNVEDRKDREDQQGLESHQEATEIAQFGVSVAVDLTTGAMGGWAGPIINVTYNGLTGGPQSAMSAAITNKIPLKTGNDLADAVLGQGYQAAAGYAISAEEAK